ncbi:putative signaling protein [Operophtera brumata]|uniref:Putative signaling protein n=1 Tax=Operophtera brumata TaxID=104452 RepID=A0A0L7L4X2_OPEBR|nr:putative signaling protein [Operophtera brumata]
MSEDQYKLVVRALEPESGDASASLVGDAIRLLLQLLQKPVFKPHWADMLTMHTLRERLSADDSDSVAQEQCRLWFEACAGVATQTPLQLETLHAARQQRVVAQYGDIRRGVAECMKEMWFSLACAGVATQTPLQLETLHVARQQRVVAQYGDIIRGFEACGGVATQTPLQLETLHAARLQRVVAQYGDIRRGVADCMKEMWFSLACAGVATQTPLQLETLHAARQQRVVAQYGDIRRGVAECMKEMWFSRAGVATQTPLQLETLHAARQQRVVAQYGDIRRGVAECMKEMWFSLACAGVATQTPLQLETLHAARRQRVVAQYGDIRMGVAECMKEMWFSLACAGVATQTPLQLETLHAARQQRVVASTETLEGGSLCLDTLVELGCGDAAWRVRFVSLCGALCGAAAGTLRQAAAALVAAAARQLDTLLLYRYEESLNGSSDDLSSQNEFATRWLERTELEISILRWFPVVSQKTYWVSPVEAAVESLRNTNRTLKSLVLEARSHDAPLQPLTMRLNGMLDPAVQGGIANYERSFLIPAYEAKHPEHKQLLTELKDLIAGQIPLLKYGKFTTNYERSFLIPAYEARHPEHKQLLTELKDLIAGQIPLLKYADDVGLQLDLAITFLNWHHWRLI